MDKEKDKKTVRGQSISFPNVFTVKELNDVYPDIIQITLRYKITTAIDRGSVIQIGTINRPVGRPHVVYGKAPLSKSIIQEAKNRGVEIYEDVEKKVKDIVSPVVEDKLKDYSEATDIVKKAIFDQSDSKIESK